MVNSVHFQRCSYTLAPTALLQLGFSRLQLQALELHGQSHVPCDLQLALEKCLRESERVEEEKRERKNVSQAASFKRVTVGD